MKGLPLFTEAWTFMAFRYSDYLSVTSGGVSYSIDIIKPGKNFLFRAYLLIFRTTGTFMMPKL